jgi:hypothetical protein
LVFTGQQGAVADHILHESRIVEGAFGDHFFVRALEYTVEFAAGGGLGEAYQIIRPESGYPAGCGLRVR